MYEPEKGFFKGWFEWVFWAYFGLAWVIPGFFILLLGGEKYLTWGVVSLLIGMVCCWIGEEIGG